MTFSAGGPPAGFFGAISLSLSQQNRLQDALVEATGKLAAYAADPKIAFYPWLRQIAFEQLIAQHRRHLGAQLRTVLREEAGSVNASSPALVERLIASETSPTRQAANKERKAQVMAAVDRLKPIDREVLVLRFVEQLSTKEAADVLGLSERGVKTRQRRAIERISSLVQEDLDER